MKLRGGDFLFGENFCFDLHADEVGDLHVVLGSDAGDGGGEEHGRPGQGDEQAAEEESN